jgi:hypothetical protein
MWGIIISPTTDRLGVKMDDLPDIEIGIESHLTEEVSILWNEHTRIAGQKKASIAELRVLRARLAEKLYEAKQQLSRVGRGGQWRAWLASVGIARSTADRLAERHSEMLGGISNVPSGAISPEEQVAELAKSTLPRLRRVLVSPEMAFRFVVLAAEGLGLTCETTEGGMLLAQPDSKQEPSAETHPILHQDESAPDPEPSLEHREETINSGSHTRYSGVRIAQPWSGYKQGV